MNKKKNKKEKLILLGLILVISIFVVFIINVLKKNVVDPTQWQYVYDEEINSDDYNYYQPKNYVVDSFNSMSPGSKTKYEYTFPDDINLNYIKFGTVSLYGLNTEVSFYTTTVEDFKELEKGLYKYYKIFYDKVTMIKKEINIANKKSYLYLSKCADNDDYKEELVVYFPEDSEDTYLELHYTTNRNRFTDAFIEKVVDGFKIKEGEANNNYCNESNEFYNCNLDLSKYYAIGKEFKFNVSSTDYFYEPDNAHYISDSLKFVKAFTDENDVDANWENVTINILYDKYSDISYIIDEYVKAYAVDYEGSLESKDELIINDKKILKYNMKFAEEYSNESFYIDKVDDHLAISIHVVTPDDPDEILKNFIDYSY